jgi:predicted O-methyltransferase YrrM
MTNATVIDGQLNATERRILTEAVTKAAKKPEVVIEVGTWLGGGSTLHILRALEQNGVGHLWGVEADKSIYERMLANIREAAPQASKRFTPIFGFSQEVIPKWLAERGKDVKVDLAFLDGGGNPGEQIDEFRLLDPVIPVGGQLLAHDAKLRKAKWLVPYMMELDHWETKMNDVSDEGLLSAVKVAAEPSPESAKAAAACLRKMRLAPAELAATYLPSSVCGFVLRLLPRRLSRRLSDGR